MEQRKVFLNENKSVKSTNEISNVSVNFDANVRLLPYSDINEKLSLYKLYTDERDNCDTYRMIFTVNPLCTNVLYNMVTEVVRNEGSSACTSMNYTVGKIPTDAVNKTQLVRFQAIRDSEFTHKDLLKYEPQNRIESDFGGTREPYVYHCGIDIFNNHLLRRQDFTYVSYFNDQSQYRDEFNTIADYIRNNSGKTVQEKINDSTIPTYMHLYQYDTVLPMYDAYKTNLNEENGWYGFTNPGNIEIPNIKIGNKEWISVNRLMNNNKACEFIDLYPDRSLFSFIPKVNKFRNRLEYNWDYDIMYPSSSDMEKVNEVCDIPQRTDEKNGGGSIKVIEVKKTYSNSGTELVRFKSMFKTTFKNGDYVRLYYKEDNGNLIKYTSRIKIVTCGDEYGFDKDRYFSIKYSDISGRFGFDYLGRIRERNDDLTLNEDVNITFYYKKEVNGYECSYYFRKFSKVDEDGLTSEINKLAYGENIYGDRMAQIVYTDDIKVGGLTDNLGMPLKEVYLVFFKTNRGYEKWYPNTYNGNGNTTDEDIEFSHCFGELTSGLDLPKECVDFNVRKLHNIDKSNISSNYIEGFNAVFGGSCLDSKPKCIENAITSNLNEIYGDIVEFDSVNFKETVIENVFHRFNTAQRECIQQSYYDIKDEEIQYDDYDIGVNARANAFKTETNIVNKFNDKLYPGNLAPEGYFYNPKTKIKLKEMSEDIEEVVVKIIKYDRDSIADVFPPYTSDVYDEEGDVVTYSKIVLTISTKYDWIKNDVVYFYDNTQKSVVIGSVNTINGNEITILVELNSINHTKLVNGDYTLTTTRETIPQYAVYLPNSRKFIWRKLLKMSELNSDDELFDMPFSNGCLYIHKNVNFFLKRQDPRNEFGLLYPEKEETQLKYYRKYGWNEYDRTEIQCIDDNFNNICY